MLKYIVSVFSLITAISIYALLAVIASAEIARGFLRNDKVHPKKTLPVLDDETHRNPVRIAFGILSSSQSTSAIDEIASAVFPHPVYVHHDFLKQPDFSPKASNVYVLQSSITTVWGDWSLVEACCSLMREAIADVEVTHFQLLSETCLPVRPIREFETFLDSERPDVMMDIISMQDEDALFTYGWRYLPLKRRLKFLLWRANLLIFRLGKQKYRVICALNLRSTTGSSSRSQRSGMFIGKRVLRLLVCARQNLLVDNGLQQFAVGSQWFGASRRTMIWLLRARHICETLTNHYQHCHIPDESYFQTLMLNAKLTGIPLHFHSGNHVLFWDNKGTGPDTLNEQDINRIQASGKFFARKFSLDKNDAMRQNILKHLK